MIKTVCGLHCGECTKKVFDFGQYIFVTINNGIQRSRKRKTLNKSNKSVNIFL